MFHYSICNIADESVFQKQCKALEKFVPQIRKEELLHDVDGSLTQLYLSLIHISEPTRH